MQFEAIGTTWSIQPHLPKALQKKVLERIEKFDKDYSRFRSDSLVTKMSQHAGEYTLPDDGKEMFDFYKKLYEVTDGLVTPLIGDLMEATGYDAKYSLKQGTLQQPLAWDEAFEYTYPKLVIKTPVLIDLGAAGKGYLVDIVGELLRKEHIKNFTINAGGDILVGDITETILLEDPHDKTLAIGQVEIEKGAICGSGIYRRNWGAFHHVVDPKKLASPEHIKAVWVKATTAMYADGIATALFFVSPQKLKKHFDFDCVIIEEDGLFETSGFKAKFFMEG